MKKTNLYKLQKKIPEKIYREILEYGIISAVDAVIYNGKKILLAKRTQEPAKGQWWIPGGRQNKGEMPENTVKRKVKEETDLDIEVEKLILSDDQLFNKTAQNIETGVHYVTRVYLAKIINPKQEISLDSTQKEYIWVDKNWFEENKGNLHEYVVKSLKASGVFE